MINYNDLSIDCDKCFGLCCIALYFSALDGFPTDKEAGKPCINLRMDFKCSVHGTLSEMGLKGCTAYDCFGAGQKVSQNTFAGKHWREVSDSAEQMFEGFLMMRQLHEMLWYLLAAFNVQEDPKLKQDTKCIIEAIEAFTKLDIENLLKLNISEQRNKVNEILRNTSESVRRKALYRITCNLNNKNTARRKTDFLGANLRKSKLIGTDLRGACMIAADLREADLSGADLIGADLRDANLCGANLKNSIFLTQGQINSAKGDIYTKIPDYIKQPKHWTK